MVAPVNGRGEAAARASAELPLVQTAPCAASIDVSPPMPPPLPTAASLYQRLDGSCHQPSMTRSKTLYSLDDAYLIGHEGGGQTGQLHHSERIDPAAQHPDMPFTPSHRLCTLLLCSRCLSGSSTGFLLLKEASSATTDSLTTRAVRRPLWPRPSLKPLNWQLLKPNRQPLKPPPQLLQRILPTNAGCQADDWQPNCDALKARLIGRGYLPPGASDERTARLVRNLMTFIAGAAEWAADDRPKPRSQRENNMSKLTKFIIRYQPSYS
uniref:Uncharacterized protein n=1 Tax=Macrostomum lignano TaxID=282301 RepID=A0A1I8FE48_9PLAT